LVNVFTKLVNVYANVSATPLQYYKMHTVLIYDMIMLLKLSDGH